jgi:hypothetical protein
LSISSSTSAGIYLDANSATLTAFSIDAESTTGDIITIDAAALTSGNVLDVELSDAFADGSAVVSIDGTALDTANIVKMIEVSSTPANDVSIAAIHVERGADDARIIWNETADAWSLDQGDGNGLVSISTGTTDLSGYVPYTGATTSVDLGANHLATTGSVFIGDGTSGSPALTFASDQDTGMYLAGTGSIGFASSGNMKAIITAQGSFGIGITPTQSHLAVYAEEQVAALSVYHVTGFGSGLTESLGILNELPAQSNRRYVGIRNVLGGFYSNQNVIGFENQWEAGDNPVAYGFRNYSMPGEYVIADDNGIFYGLSNVFTADQIWGNNNVLYGVYNDMATDNEGATSETVYGVYSKATTYLEGTDRFYGEYITSDAASTGGTQYGVYVDLSAGTAIKYPGIFIGGNVGIGTTSPVTSLDVAGPVRIATADGGLFIDSGATTTASALTIDASQTTADVITIDALALTTGQVMDIRLGSAYVSTTPVQSIDATANDAGEEVTVIAVQTDADQVVTPIRVVRNGGLDARFVWNETVDAWSIDQADGNGLVSFATAAASTAYVPYTGASQGVNLGMHYVATTGTVSVGSGSAAAPAFTFGSDPDNGMYRVGTNTIGFATDGTAQMVVNSSGNVGIGTTSPSYPLSLYRNDTNAEPTQFITLDHMNSAGNGAAGQGGSILFRNEIEPDTLGSLATIQGVVSYTGGGGGHVGYLSFNTWDAGQFNESLRILGSPNSAAEPVLSIRGDTNTGWFHPADDVIAFSTLGSERLRIDDSGFVGIGTTSPVTSLDVAGPVRINTDAGGLFIDSGATTTASALTIDAAQTTADVITIDALALTTGNVLDVELSDAFADGSAVVSIDGAALDTANIVKMIEVSSTPANDVSIAAIHVERGADDARIIWNETADAWSLDQGDGNGLVSISTGSTDLSGYVPYTGATTSVDLGANHLATTGSVFIGSGTAGSPAVTFASDQDTGIYLVGTNSIGITTAGTSRAVFDPNGDLGIGVANPLARLHVQSGSDTGLDTVASGIVGVFDNSDNITDNASIAVHSGRDGYASIYLGAYDLETDGGILYKYTGSSAGMHFKVGDITSRIFIKDGGGIGVGTTSPVTSLDVAGPVRINTADGGLFIDSGATTTASALTIDAAQTTADVITIDALALTTGNVLDVELSDAFADGSAVVSIDGTALDTANIVKLIEVASTPANDVSIAAIHVERGADDARIIWNETADAWSLDQGDGNGLVAISTGSTDLTGYVPYTGATGSVDLSSHGLVAGVVSLGDGSAAAPSLTFESDPDNGMYLFGTNSIGFSTAGTDRMLLTNDGTAYFNSRIGIGDMSPEYVLDVNAPTSGIVASFAGPNSTNVDIYTSTTNSSLRAYYGSTAYDFSMTGGPYAGSSMTILSTGNFRFSGGKVGIGTSAPIADLSIDTSIGGGIFLDADSTSVTAFSIDAESTTGDIITIDAGQLTTGQVIDIALGSAYTSTTPVQSIDATNNDAGEEITALAVQTDADQDVTPIRVVRNGDIDARIIWNETADAWSLDQGDGNGLVSISTGVTDLSGYVPYTGATTSVDLGANHLATTGSVFIGDGTAGSPALTFAGDQDTGIYLAGTGSIGFATAGAQRAFIANSGTAVFNGYVGVGTTSPSGIFQVNSPAGRVFEVSSTGGGGITIDDGYGRGLTISGNHTMSYYTFGNNGNADVKHQFTNSGDLTNADDDLALLASGATFAPNSGTADFSSIMINSTINQTGTAAGTSRGIFIDPTLTSATEWRAIEIASNEGFGIYQSGSGAANYLAGMVGIGTTSPVTSLDVAGQVRISTAEGGLFIDSGATTTANALSIEASQTTADVITIDALALTTGTVLSIDVDSTQMTAAGNAIYVANESTVIFAAKDLNVGIGTSNPRERLEVNNTAVFTQEYNNGTQNIDFGLDWSNGNKQVVTLSDDGGDQNITITLSGPDGGVGNLLLRVVQGDASNMELTWAAASGSVKWSGGAAPSLTNGSGSEDIITCFTNGNDFYCAASLDFQ